MRAWRMISERTQENGHRLRLKPFSMRALFLMFSCITGDDVPFCVLPIYGLALSRQAVAPVELLDPEQLFSSGAILLQFGRIYI